jgi:hypothetical protein
MKVQSYLTIIDYFQFISLEHAQLMRSIQSARVHKCAMNGMQQHEHVCVLT